MVSLCSAPFLYLPQSSASFAVYCKYYKQRQQKNKPGRAKKNPCPRAFRRRLLYANDLEPAEPADIEANMEGHIVCVYF